MRLRPLWIALRGHLNRPWGRLALCVIVVVVLCWNMSQWWSLRPGSKVPPQVPNAVVCVRCDWRGWRETPRLPQRCPKCREMTLHFAGVCPKCGEWTPWNLAKEKELYAQPRLFLDLGPAYFFPKCRKCGAQTTPRGAAPVSRAHPLEHDAPSARGDKPWNPDTN
ncbi:MAG TPA: hypothetical protein DGT21_19370 [Armatimonadetes bacterium]|jgi:hypothetical protein|nr:hypothetical protein [Armatimonadota bacterium]